MSNPTHEGMTLVPTRDVVKMIKRQKKVARIVARLDDSPAKEELRLLIIDLLHPLMDALLFDGDNG